MLDLMDGSKILDDARKQWSFPTIFLQSKILKNHILSPAPWQPSDGRSRLAPMLEFAMPAGAQLESFGASACLARLNCGEPMAVFVSERLCQRQSPSSYAELRFERMQRCGNAASWRASSSAASKAFPRST